MKQTGPEKKLLYLLEFSPISDHIFEKQIVKDRLEKFFYEFAEKLGCEIDSCDILYDFIAITIYVNSSINIEIFVTDLQKQSSELLVKEFIEFKQFLVDDSLWNEESEIELL